MKALLNDPRLNDTLRVESFSDLMKFIVHVKEASTLTFRRFSEHDSNVIKTIGAIFVHGWHDNRLTSLVIAFG